MKGLGFSTFAFDNLNVHYLLSQLCLQPGQPFSNCASYFDPEFPSMLSPTLRTDFPVFVEKQ